MSKYTAMAIFGSSSNTIDPAFKAPIFETGALLARQGITMIYGVGDEGLMGESFRGVRSEGGKVLGVTIPTLLNRQCADTSIYNEGELKIVETLSERKHLMMEGADALLIAPGGWGTLDEIASHGVHAKIGDWTNKPLIFLNFNGFWEPLKALFQNMLEHGALQKDQLKSIDYANSPADILEAVERVQQRLRK